MKTKRTRHTPLWKSYRREIPCDHRGFNPDCELCAILAIAEGDLT